MLGSHVAAGNAERRGSVQEKERARLREIIAQLDDLFGRDTTVQDQLVHMNHVI